MRGDGEGESEAARKNGGKLNNDIKITRPKFVKASAAFDAAVAGVSPYNLTDIAGVFLKEDGELIVYPAIYKHISKIFQLFIIELWGCNWNCRWCVNKFTSLKDMTPLIVSIDEIIGLTTSMCSDSNAPVMFVIGGGEPSLQKTEVLNLIKSLKTRKTSYIVNLETNGSFINEHFIDKANNFGLDRITISFRNPDNKWHKWYTGHSNQSTINALKLVTEKFKGLAVVTLSLFSEIDIPIFKNICKFLYEINPNFVIRISCPLHDIHEYEECYEKRRNKAEEIASLYFDRVVQNPNERLPIEMMRYKIERDERGGMNILKSWEHKIKKRKEAMKHG